MGWFSTDDKVKRRIHGRNVATREVFLRSEPRRKGAAGGAGSSWPIWAGYTLLIVAALGGLIWLGSLGVDYFTRVVFTENRLFVVRHFDLASDGKLRPRHLQDYAELDKVRNLFAADLGKIRYSLERVPVIKEVQVRRILPSTLQVRVVERIPIVRIDGGNQLEMTMDNDGYVVGMSSTQMHVPIITGIPTRGLRPGSQVPTPIVRTALRVVELCDTTRYGEMIDPQILDVSNPDRLVLRLAGDVEVLMPTQNLETSLRRLADVLQKARERGESLKRIDVTADRNVVVEPKEIDPAVLTPPIP